MDPATVTVILTAAGGTATAIATRWLRARVQCTQAREASRRQHVTRLPAGSRIIDRGSQGIVIEVGTGEGNAGGRG